ncbi:MAG: hypothetical protein ACI9FN_004103 [Saprospiraceae bacterium]|jgi:hypothetical protein
MKLTLFCAFLGLLMNQAISQESYAAANNWENTLSEWVLKKNIKSKDGDEKLPSVRDKYEKHSGSPFYNDGVVQGSLISSRGDRIDNLFLLYDLFKNELYFLKDEQEQMLIKPYLKEIEVQSKGETKVLRKVNPFKLDGFYVVIFEDEELVLFEDQEVNLIEGVNKGMIAVAPKFMKSSSHKFIVKKRPTEILEVNLKKKDLLKMLPSERAKACRNYLRNNKKFKF